MYLWRQWRNGHKRFTELRRLGLAKFAASVAAGSPTGLWRISSEEAAVMVVERRGWVIDDESGQLATGGARSSTEGGSLQSMARAG